MKILKTENISHYKDVNMRKLSNALSAVYDVIKSDESKYTTLLKDKNAAKVIMRYLDCVNAASHDNDNSSEIKLRCSFIEYDRYPTGNSPIHTAVFKGEDEVHAFAELADGLNIYLSAEEISEDDMTVEEILDAIEKANGDGCDYIFRLENLSTGKVYIDEDVEL